MFELILIVIVFSPLLCKRKHSNGRRRVRSSLRIFCQNESEEFHAFATWTVSRSNCCNCWSQLNYWNPNPQHNHIASHLTIRSITHSYEGKKFTFFRSCGKEKIVSNMHIKFKMSVKRPSTKKRKCKKSERMGEEMRITEEALRSLHTVDQNYPHTAVKEERKRKTEWYQAHSFIHF